MSKILNAISEENSIDVPNQRYHLSTCVKNESSNKKT